MRDNRTLHPRRIALFLIIPFCVALAQGPPGFRSIHQLDLEKHRDFRADEKQQAPVFTGTPMTLQKRANPPDREIFGYLPYWVYNNYPNLNYDLLTTVAYFGAQVSDAGNLTDLHDWPAAGLINTAHANGVRVLLTAHLFNASELATLLNSESRRTNLVNNLVSQVQSAGADGVNIDFESVPAGQKANLTAFMTELTEAFHSAIPGSFVTIFTPAVDWSNVFDYHALAQITDGLVIQGYDYSWSGAANSGPVAPLTGSRTGFANVSWTVNDYLTKTGGNSEKMIQSVPFYGFEWVTAGSQPGSATQGRANSIFFSEAYSNAQTYGRIWDAESQTPWYRYDDGQWHQGWYDDSLSLALKFDFFKDKNLKGTAIWALSYDGQRLELQSALADAFGATAPPLRPAALRIISQSVSAARVATESASGATAYKIFRSTDGVTFDDGTSFPNAAATLTNLSPDTITYIKVAASNGNGNSNTTEVLAVHTAETVRVLLVNGFDRTIGTNNTFDFVRRFAPSIVNAGYAFDACANEALQNGLVRMDDYDMVLWIAGEEGTADESFSSDEQALIADFLENGGSLFVSGSEIGYDLVAQGSTADQAFYRDYLKAQYIRDDAGVYAASGTAQGIFEGLINLTFDNGSHGTYNVDFPDGINPVGGAVLNMTYNNVNPTTNGGAGIAYDGIFGNGSAAGRVVYLGFPFETIYPAAARDSVMARTLRFLDNPQVGISQGTPATSIPAAFALDQNYPNPFNPSTTIAFRITHFEDAPVTLKVFNLTGAAVITLFHETGGTAPGEYQLEWNGLDANGQPVSSGVYFYILRISNRVMSRSMHLVR